jgi:hypothetical protein
MRSRWRGFCITRIVRGKNDLKEVVSPIPKATPATLHTDRPSGQVAIRYRNRALTRRSVFGC